MRPILFMLLLIGAGLGAILYAKRNKASASKDPDEAVLDRLRAVGADLTKATEVIFYVYTPTREGAEQVASAAAVDSLRSEVTAPAAGDSSWRCVLTGDMVPTLGRIKEIGRRLSDLSAAVGGEYDGWEAAVTK